MGKVESRKDLSVWQKATSLAAQVYRLGNRAEDWACQIEEACGCEIPGR